VAARRPVSSRCELRRGHRYRPARHGSGRPSASVAYSSPAGGGARVNSPFEEITNLDRLVHEPARLAILTALEACRPADFMYLQSLTGLAKGNLSQHLAKLEAASLISLTRGFSGKVPKTVVRLTTAGRSAVRVHWRRLEQTRKAAAGWSGQWRRTAADE